VTAGCFVFGIIARMKKLLLLAAVLAFGSCKKSDDAAKGGGGDGPSCEAAISKAVAKLPAGMNPTATGVSDRLKAVLTARCTEDKWPAEVIACYEGASSMPAMKACREKLSPELASKAQVEIQRAMMLGGAMGAAGHAPAPKVPMPDPAAGAGAAGGAGAAMGSADSAGSAAAAPAASGAAKP